MFSGSVIESSGFMKGLLMKGASSVWSWFCVNWYWFVIIIGGFFLFVWLYGIVWSFVLSRLQK